MSATETADEALPERRRRSDAERNRQRVLDAAVEVFAERGIDAQIPDVARRAGVGIATVYRNFPSKRALLSALMEQRVADLEAFVRGALAEELDPWSSFVELLRRAAAAQAADSAFRQYMLATTTCSPVAAARERLLDATGELMRRAQAAGQLRPDVAAEDVPLLLMGLGWALCGVGGTDSNLWERYLAIMVDGLRAEGANPLPHAPLERDDLVRLLADARGGDEAAGPALPC